MSHLSARQKVAVSRISGLILINAMIFQEVLAEHDDRVLPLQRVVSEGNILNDFCEHWQFILDRINYYPIFNVARQILLNVTANHDVVAALGDLTRKAQQIVSMRAALRHDLMGRVFHRLLAEAKYLGTYYTSIPAATILLKLALEPEAWNTEWHDLEDIAELRIADLACGTGTLLMAAADALTDNYIRSSALRALTIRVDQLHSVLAEKVFYGYDVLVSAIHLTASTLALRAPETTFESMNLYSLPLGGQQRRLGSIEFLKDRVVPISIDLFAESDKEQVDAKGSRKVHEIKLPAIDLCVMNPPFTRSVGGNLLFGSLPEKERKRMQIDLKRLVKGFGVQANITAGLGSIFVATADHYIRPGGRIALVLPKAMLSGVSWKATRDLLSQSYRVNYIVVSHDPLRWNFSENTNLSEVLLVATKAGENNTEKQQSGVVTAISLWHNPVSAFKSLAIAHEIIGRRAPDIEQGQGASEITCGNHKVGEAVSVAWDQLSEASQWLAPCAFAQSDLVRASWHLSRGRLWLPGHGITAEVGIRNLGEFVTLGPDARDIHDGFQRTQTPTAYPALWGHKAEEIRTIAMEANSYLVPLGRAKKGRPLRKVEQLWPLAGRILLAERLRLNTQRLTAVKLDRSVLSNMWWPLTLRSGLKNELYEKSLVLWLNSTLGLVLLFLNRVETMGAWVKFKKPILRELPVIDLQGLSKNQLGHLSHAYDDLSGEPLQPFPKMCEDQVRARIDGLMAETLGLPDFSVLRSLLAQEPIVCLNPL